MEGSLGLFKLLDLHYLLVIVTLFADLTIELFDIGLGKRLHLYYLIKLKVPTLTNKKNITQFSKLLVDFVLSVLSQMTVDRIIYYNRTFDLVQTLRIEDGWFILDYDLSGL